LNLRQVNFTLGELFREELSGSVTLFSPIRLSQFHSLPRARQQSKEQYLIVCLESTIRIVLCLLLMLVNLTLFSPASHRIDLSQIGLARLNVSINLPEFDFAENKQKEEEVKKLKLSFTLSLRADGTVAH
jgi:hypothetical protein